MRRFQFPTKERRERLKQSQNVERMMEQAGIVRSRGTANPFHAAWYHNQQYLPEFKSAYLDQLTKLRELLIQTEHHNLKENAAKSQTKFTSPRDNMAAKTQGMPARGARILRGKNYNSGQNTKEGQNTLFRLRSSTNDGRDTRSSGKYSHRAFPRIESQNNLQQKSCKSARYSASEERPQSWPDLKRRLSFSATKTRDNLTPQSSIPNIGRRALTQTDNIKIPLEKTPNKTLRGKTFVCRKKIHGKGDDTFSDHHYLRADSDEVCLTQEIFQFDLPEVFPDNEVKKVRASSGLRQSFSEPCYHPHHKVLCIQKRRCPVTSHPGQQPKYRNISRLLHLSTKLQNEILRQYEAHGNHKYDINANDGRCDCIFCENPAVTMIPTGQGQFLMIDGPAETSVDDGNLELLQGEETQDRSIESNSDFQEEILAKRELVVEMPKMPLSPLKRTHARVNSAASAISRASTIITIDDYANEMKLRLPQLIGD